MTAFTDSRLPDSATGNIPRARNSKPAGVHPMLRFAFKEWAVICQALAEGRQALILRKGGIAEHGGGFRVEPTPFWLYPPYFHEKQSGLPPQPAGRLQKDVAGTPAPPSVSLETLLR